MKNIEKEIKKVNKKYNKFQKGFYGKNLRKAEEAKRKFFSGEITAEEYLALVSEL